MVSNPDISFVRLMKVARTELGTQLSQDAQLLQAEIREKTSTVTSAGAIGVAGLIMLFLSVAFGLAALVLYLASVGISPALATLIVALLAGLLAAICLLWARSVMRSWTPVPHRTVQAVRADIAALRKAVTHVSQ